jgi:outer membrane protein
MLVRKGIVAVALFLAMGLSALGVQAADLKIGVMNVQKIIVLCDAGKEAKGRFEVRMKELQGKFKGEEDNLVALQKDIEKKSSAWSEEKKSEKTREFQKLRRELQAKTEDARFELKQLQDKELEPILKALEGVVDKFGKDNGYTTIFDSKNGVIYFDNAIDVSETVVKQLNAAMAKK